MITQHTTLSFETPMHVAVMEQDNTQGHTEICNMQQSVLVAYLEEAHWLLPPAEGCLSACYYATLLYKRLAWPAGQESK